MVGKRAPTAERFLDKFEKAAPNECWEWKANKNNQGYGLLWSPEDGRKVLAHRYSFTHFRGQQIAPGYEIRHKCDNPSCVNPDHLEPGTHRQNIIDRSIRGRHGYKTMDEMKVISLLKDYVSGLSRKAISAKYGVPIASLSDYTDGKHWTHLHGIQGCPTYEDLQNAKRRKPNSLISIDDVRTIRRRLADGESCAAIARDYGMKTQSIHDIKQRRNWKDVD